MDKYTPEMMRVTRLAAISLLPATTDYVVVVPYKGQNGPSERVAYGYSIPLTKRAAGQLAKAVQPLYKAQGAHTKPRAIMMKTALRG
jgi:hypothetical protein